MQPVGRLQHHGSIFHLYVGQHVTHVPAHCSLWLHDVSLRPRGTGSCYREQNCSLNCNLSSETAFLSTKWLRIEAAFPICNHSTQSSFRSHTSCKIIWAWREIARLAAHSPGRGGNYIVSWITWGHLRGPRLLFSRTQSPVFARHAGP